MTLVLLLNSVKHGMHGMFFRQGSHHTVAQVKEKETALIHLSICYSLLQSLLGSEGCQSRSTGTHERCEQLAWCNRLCLALGLSTAPHV